MSRWVLIGLFVLTGCAAPHVDPPAVAPMVKGCHMCRWVNAEGEVSFSRCDLPPGAAVAGWESSGHCSYWQAPPPAVPVPTRDF